MKRSLGLWCPILLAAGCAELPAAAAPVSPASVATAAPSSPSAPTTREEPPAPAIQGPAGDIPLLAQDGRRVRLAKYGRDVTVIALWASWCASCRAELPCLEELYQRYAADPAVAFLAISIDDLDAPEDRGRVLEAAARLGITMPIFFDHQGAAMERLAHQRKLLPSRERKTARVGLPVVLIIDRDFRIDREMGWGYGSCDAYIAAKQAEIEAAKQGRLVARDRTMDPRTTPKPYDMIKIEFPPLSADERQRAAPEVRRELKSRWPHLTDSQIDDLMPRIEPAIHKGEAVMVEIPAPGAPANLD